MVNIVPGTTGSLPQCLPKQGMQDDTWGHVHVHVHVSEDCNCSIHGHTWAHPWGVVTNHLLDCLNKARRRIFVNDTVICGCKLFDAAPK